MSVAHWATATASLKLEDDLAAALTLRGACDRGFDFAERVSFFDFCFEQTSPGHIEKWLKRFHALRGRGVVVPFVDPDTAKSQVFRSEERRVGKECRSKRLTVHQT